MIEGDYSFFKDAPWHSQGIILGRGASVEEALALVCPFEYQKLSDFTLSAGSESISAPGYSAVVRVDPTGKEAHRLLGIHSDRYEVTPPADLLELFRPMIESGEIKLVAGGSLYEGKRLWFLAEVRDTEAEVLKGDSIKKFVLIQTSFDGSLSDGMGNTDVRVVCANTLLAAQGDVTMKSKHTKHGMDRLAQHRNTLARIIHDHHETVEKYRFLARKAMSRKQQEEYITQVMAPTLLDPSTADDVSTKLRNKVRDVIDLIDNQEGLKLVPAMRGTMWQAYNAITDYNTHHVGNSVDSRVASQWNGPVASLTSKAFELALSF